MRLLRLLRTESFRLVALYVLAFAVAVAALGGLAAWTTKSAMEQQVRERIDAEITYLRREFARGGLPALLAVVRQRDSGISALDYRLEDARGTVLAGELPVPVAAPGWHRIQVAEADELGTEPELLLAAYLPDGSRIAVGDDLGRVEDAWAAIGPIFGAVVAGVVVLGIAGGTLISIGFVRRLDAISDTAEAIIEGDLSRRIPSHGTRGDLDRLVATLNRMLDTNEALLGTVRHLSVNVAHDLRTPLSQLRQILEDSRQTATTPDEFRAALDEAVARSETMQQIFGALLRIAQIEAGPAGLDFEPVDLGDVLHLVGEAYAPLLEQEGSTLEVTAADACVVDGDRDLLVQMLANLMENAAQHTPPGSAVRAEVRRLAAGVALVVQDDGPGIPAAERGRVLERFYRCERSRTTPGHGLGLSLVAAIVDLHGATLALEDARPGLRVRIRLPASRAAARTARQPSRMEAV